MSNLIRWQPAREIMTLREAMDHLFDDAFTRPLSLRENWSIPAIDMYQTENEVVIKAAIPGINPDAVHVNVTGEMLTIKGEIKQEEESKEKAWHIREQRWGSFERTVSLPVAVKADSSKAEYVNGVLVITLPKADEVKPKTITVKVK